MAIAVVIAVIKTAVEANHGSYELSFGTGSPTADDPRLDEFRGRVRLDHIASPTGHLQAALTLEVRGVVHGVSDSWPGLIRVGAVDVTEGEDQPTAVWCSDQALSDEETGVFEYRGTPMTFDEITLFNDWTPLVSVPTDSLRFAGNGQRRLTFFFVVSEADQDDAIHCDDEVDCEVDALPVGAPGEVAGEALDPLDSVAMERVTDRLRSEAARLDAMVAAATEAERPAENELVQP